MVWLIQVIGPVYDPQSAVLDTPSFRPVAQKIYLGH